MDGKADKKPLVLNQPRIRMFTTVSSSMTCAYTTTIMGSVIGVLVALQVGTLITLCVVVVYFMVTLDKV